MDVFLDEPKVLCVIQARLGSSRLPRKTLADLHGSPVIEHVVHRTRAMRLCHQVVAVVPHADVDLIDVLHSLDVDVVTGSEENVLERYVSAALQFNAAYVVRVTGDCPFFDPRAGDDVIGHITSHSRCGYVSNDTELSGWPDGTDVECTRRYLLEDALAHPQCDSKDKEHVMPFVRRQVLTHMMMRTYDGLSDLKLSIDTQDDLDRARSIWNARPLDSYSIDDTIRSVCAAGLL